MTAKYTLYNIDNSKEVEPVEGYRARFVHAENMTFAFWDIKKGHAVPAHSHPHEQVIKMLDGKLELKLEGKIHILEPGMVLVIPGGVEHSAYSLTDCKAIDTFHPVREDYKNL